MKRSWKIKLIATVALLVALTSMACQPITREASMAKIDNAALIQQYDATWNTHDLAGIMAYFADDAVVVPVPPIPGGPAQFVGKEQVQGFVQALLPNFAVEGQNYQADGNKVTWWFKVSSDFFAGMGVNPITGTGEAIIEGGKIKSFSPIFSQETVAKLIARTEAAEIESKGNLALVDQLMADDFVLHFPGYPPMDREGFKGVITAFRTGFSDLQVTVEDQIAEGNKVTNRLVIRGTQDGAFNGVPASGKTIEVTGINIMRIEQGQIHEIWGSPDVLGLLQQIGAIPMPGQ